MFVIVNTIFAPGPLFPKVENIIENSYGTCYRNNALTKLNYSCETLCIFVKTKIILWKF